jgi:tetratricopeptide (TPR) repeat protein
MQIIGIVVWVFALIWAITQGLSIRQKAKNEQATEHTFEVHASLAMVSVIMIPVLSLSPFHLLWMLPASFLLGLASSLFPFRLLWFPASLYGSLWYFGVKNPCRAFYLAGDYVKAIECYKNTARVKPNSSEVYFNLGLAYDKARNFEEAIKAYENSIRLDPKISVTHYNLGFSYKDLGDFHKAIECFKEAIKIKPDYEKAIWILGSTYVEIGEIENALKEYKILQKYNEELANELYTMINQ